MLNVCAAARRCLIFNLLFFLVPVSYASEDSTRGQINFSSASISTLNELIETSIASLVLRIEGQDSVIELTPRNLSLIEFIERDDGWQASGEQSTEDFNIHYQAHASSTSQLVRLAVEVKALTDSGRLGITIEVKPGDSVQLTKQPGFSAMYSYLKPVLVDDTEQVTLDEYEAGTDINCNGCWFGYRTHLNTFLVTEALNIKTTLAYSKSGVSKQATLNGLTVDGKPDAEQSYKINLLIYHGPLEYNHLAAVDDKKLMNMLYSHLWDWVRFLVFGIKSIAYFLFSLCGNWGITIILLALCMRILIFPLTTLADKYQKEALQNQQLLQPEISRIKKEFRGEEQSKQLFKLYESHGIHPLSGFKGFLGLAIQLPILIAIFAFLSELQPISTQSFLWIRDLSLPDTLFLLPFAIPFFGNAFNLLPFIMLLVSNISAYFGLDPELSGEAIRRLRKNALLLSLLFFLLFYSFPAAMVLYWTCSVFFEVIQKQLLKPGSSGALDNT